MLISPDLHIKIGQKIHQTTKMLVLFHKAEVNFLLKLPLKLTVAPFVQTSVIPDML